MNEAVNSRTGNFPFNFKISLSFFYNFSFFLSITISLSFFCNVSFLLSITIFLSYFCLDLPQFSSQFSHLFPFHNYFFYYSFFLFIVLSFHPLPFHLFFFPFSSTSYLFSPSIPVILSFTFPCCLFTFHTILIFSFYLFLFLFLYPCFIH